MPIYGCFDKPRPSHQGKLVVQSGYAWSPATGGRQDHMELIQFVMTEDCQYTKTHATDKYCAGCIHQHKE
jgi:hypothetical protein